MGNRDVSKPNNDGERELIDRAVKALEAELATKTCNKQIVSKLENAELARDSEETCNNKQVISKLVASEDAISIQVVIEWLKAKDIIKLSSQEETARKELEALSSVTPKQEPREDTVSLGVFEQVMWERDVAIEQLKELGYCFGEKPKTGHWIVLSATDMYCSECNEIENLDTSRRFCAYCGAKMVEPQESEER